MLRRAACLGLATVAFAGVTAPAFAATSPGTVTVTYTVDPTGPYVGVGTGLPGQPLFGARVDGASGDACVGFSYQIPQCVQSPITGVIEVG